MDSGDDLISEPTAPPADSGDGDDDSIVSEPTASPIMVVVAPPTEPPIMDTTLFPTMETLQPTLDIVDVTGSTLEPTTFGSSLGTFVETTPGSSFETFVSQVLVQGSQVLVQGSSTRESRNSGNMSAAPSSVPSLVEGLRATGGGPLSDPPSWVPSDAPSSIPSTSPGPSSVPTITQSAVGLTSLPTQQDSEQIAVIDNEDLERETPGYTLWLEPDAVNLQAVGSVDVNSVREVFFGHVERLIKPYMADHVGDILQKFQLNIEFLPTKTRSVSVGITGQRSMTLSYFDVLVKMQISSQSIEDLNLFQDKQATAAVASFFEGHSLGALISSLNQAKIPINTILHAELSMEDYLENLHTIGEGQQVGGSNQSAKATNDEDEDEDKTAALYAALVSGGAVLVAIVLAILYNRRRKRRFEVHYPGESSKGSLYTDSNASTASTIKPAAITLRNKSTDEASVQSAMSSLYHNSAFKKRGFSFLPSRLSLDSDQEGEEKECFSEDQEQGSQFVNKGEMVCVDDNPNYAVTSALTCLDGAQHNVDLPNQYPEFDLYSNMPPSSPWSADGISIPYSYKVDDEEYQNERRRWRDEADDLALIAIPDPSVAGSETKSDSSDCYDERAEL